MRSDSRRIVDGLTGLPASQNFAAPTMLSGPPAEIALLDFHRKVDNAANGLFWVRFGYISLPSFFEINLAISVFSKDSIYVLSAIITTTLCLAGKTRQPVESL